MGRLLRHLPERDDDGWTLVELTSRTFQRRFLLRPGSKLVRLFIGVLARAQRLTGIVIHEVVVLSTHFHILASVRDVKMQADFMAFTKRWITDEVQRHTGWKGSLWEDRFDPTPISDEEAAQYRRLEYVYSQGVKENLVASPEDWPGVSTVSARLAGYREVEGDWIDHTGMTRARQRGETPNERDYTEAETLHLSPLPLWAHLDAGQYRKRIRDLVERIRREARARHEKEGTRPMGPERVRLVDPFDAPLPEKRRPRPMFHAASKEVRMGLRHAYALFADAYRTASERYRRGEKDVSFPRSCFLPPRAFGHGWQPRPP